MKNAVRDIATAAGATLQPALQPGELIAFTICQDRSLLIETAAGEQFTAISQSEVAAVAAEVLTAESLIQLLARQTYLPIGADPRGRRFIRRVVVVDGRQSIRFSEAGRDA